MTKTVRREPEARVPQPDPDCSELVVQTARLLRKVPYLNGCLCLQLEVLKARLTGVTRLAHTPQPRCCLVLDDGQNEPHTVPLDCPASLPHIWTE